MFFFKCMAYTLAWRLRGRLRRATVCVKVGYARLREIHLPTRNASVRNLSFNLRSSCGSISSSISSSSSSSRSSRSSRSSSSSISSSSSSNNSSSSRSRGSRSSSSSK